MSHCELRTNQTGEHRRVKIANELLKLVFAWHEFSQSAGEDILISVSLNAKWQYFSLLLYRHSPRYTWLQKGTFVLSFDEGETSKLWLLLTHYLKYFQWAVASCRSFVLETVVPIVLLCQTYRRYNCVRVSEKGAWAIEETVQLHNAIYGSISSHQVVVLSRRWILPAVQGEAVGRVKTHHPMCNCILYLRQQLWHEVRRMAACTFAEKRRNEWQI